MTFGNITASSLGFAIINRDGFYDMPNRIGKSYYDWGNEIQPLVSSEDIVFESQSFELKVLFDNRISGGNTFSQSINSIEQLGQFDLVINGVPSPFDYEKLSVVLDSVKDVKTYSNSTIATLNFYCQKPETHSVIIFPITENSDYRMFGKKDGSVAVWHDLKNFNIIVQKVLNIESKNPLRSSKATVYKNSKSKLSGRYIEQLEVHCYLVSDSPETSNNNICAFKNLLSYEEMKQFYYKGTVYDCFYSEGFKVEVSRNGKVLKFVFKLNIV